MRRPILRTFTLETEFLSRFLKKVVIWLRVGWVKSLSLPTMNVQ